MGWKVFMSRITNNLFDKDNVFCRSTQIGAKRIQIDQLQTTFSLTK